MQAKDIMNKEVVSVLVDATVKEVAKLIIDRKISGIPVINDQRTVLGVISEVDLMHAQVPPGKPSVWQLFTWQLNGDEERERYQEARRRHLAKTARDIMTSPAVTADELDDIEKVGQLMFQHRIKRVFITKNGALTGVISRSAFVKRLLEDS